MANDKRDMMAAIIIQSVATEKLKWLGEHKRLGRLDRMEGLLNDGVRDIVTGTYVLVDEMLKQSANPNLVDPPKPMDAKQAIDQKPAIDSKPAIAPKPVDPKPADPTPAITQKVETKTQTDVPVVAKANLVPPTD